MSQNLYEAHRQWAKRPKDERFPDLDALHAYVKSRKSASTERESKLRQLHIMSDEHGALMLNGDSDPSRLTHWSFGQLCTWLKAPASYLRTLPSDLTVKCLQASQKRYNAPCQLLRRGADVNWQDSPVGHIAALTGPRYSRIWDVDVISTISDATENSPWKVPPARSNNDSDCSGLYASDRDMFVFMVNDAQTVEVEGVKLGRGFFCWNSETGAASFGLTTFLYNYICGNHIVWGAENVNELRIVHRDNAAIRFQDDVLPSLQAFLGSSQNHSLVTDIVARAMRQPVGNELEQVLKWAEDKSFSQREITSAWELGQSEGENVSTLWGLVQGLTASARQIPYTNVRVNLERRAGELLKLAA